MNSFFDQLADRIAKTIAMILLLSILFLIGAGWMLVTMIGFM